MNCFSGHITARVPHLIMLYGNNEMVNNETTSNTDQTHTVCVCHLGEIWVRSGRDVLEVRSQLLPLNKTSRSNLH
jgi:hypothetical protein